MYQNALKEIRVSNGDRYTVGSRCRLLCTDNVKAWKSGELSCFLGGKVDVVFTGGPSAKASLNLILSSRIWRQ